MPHGDTCVSHLFEPGAIPASAGMTPILPTTAEPPSGQATVTAAIVEAAAATDATTGLSIVAIIEAAAAASTVNAGIVYVASIVEASTAADLSSASVPGVFSGAIAETATAGSAQDAAVAAPARSAMVPGAFVNPSASRQANVAGIMVNL